MARATPGARVQSSLPEGSLTRIRFVQDQMCDARERLDKDGSGRLNSPDSSISSEKLQMHWHAVREGQNERAPDSAT